MNEMWSARHEGGGAWTDLQTEAWLMETLSGRLDPPGLRGADVPLIGEEGQLWRPKVVDVRVLSLGFVVLGANPTTGASTEPQKQFNDNLKLLMDLLYTSDKRVEFRRVWQQVSGSVTLYGRGQWASGMEPRMTGRFRCKFVADFRMTDPYWYTNEGMTTGARLW